MEYIIIRLVENVYKNRCMYGVYAYIFSVYEYTWKVPFFFTEKYFIHYLLFVNNHVKCIIKANNKTPTFQHAREHINIGSV